MGSLTDTLRNFISFIPTIRPTNIVEILMRLAHEAGYCVVIVTHDLAIADAADVVYTVADGVLTG